jgi:hypothetical protein
MNIQLNEEILKSNSLRRYIKLQRLTRYIPAFRWAAGITFILGLIDFIPDNEMSFLLKFLFIAIWIPGIAFAFIGAILHFITGKELRRLSTKYKINETDLKKLADDLLSNLK